MRAPASSVCAVISHVAVTVSSGLGEIEEVFVDFLDHDCLGVAHAAAIAHHQLTEPLAIDEDDAWLSPSG